MPILRTAALLTTATILTGCSSEQIIEAVGLDQLDFNHAGITYNSLPGTFSGAPETTNLPTSGTATFTGPMRGSLNGEWNTGAATLLANFDTSSVALSGTVDLSAAKNGSLISISKTAPINGTSFSSAETNTNPGDTSIEGQFYNGSASAVAGKVEKITAAGDVMNGQFILSQ